MNGASLDILKDNLEKLKQAFPELFAENELDWEKLKAVFSNVINFSNERYTLNWAGKADSFKTLQISTTATLVPQREESINFDISENVFIEGENLEVLKILQKAYHSKIKVIYIDPPYNTGTDSFVYPDKFGEKKENYLKRIGDKDQEGNVLKETLFRKNNKDSGHFHSNWLSMMYPRLSLAKNLLREDGVIFVHIDDNEVHNLRLLLNEIFGEENFVGCFIWRKKTGGGQTDDFFVTEHEYVLVFRKSDKFIWLDEIQDDTASRYSLEDDKGKYKIIKLAKWGSAARKEDRPTMHFPIKSPDEKDILPKAPDGSEGRWRVGKKRMQQLIDNKLIHWESMKDEWIPYEKNHFDPSRGKKLKQRSILYDIANTGDGTNALTDLFGVKDIFDNPKPVELPLKFIEKNVDDGEIVLDFFGGSGTLAQAVFTQNKLDGYNRKFLIVQIPEATKQNSVAKSQGFNSIAEMARVRIKKVIEQLEAEKIKKPDSFVNNNIDLGFRSFKLASSNFKIWRSNEITEETLLQQLDAFTDSVTDGSTSQNMIYELMLKAGYLLTDKVAFENECYSVNDGEIIIALDRIDNDIIQQVITTHPKKFIVLDKLFSGQDQLKTNTALHLEDAGIDFKSI